MKKSVSALLAIFLIPSAAFCAATGDASIPTKAVPTTSDKVTIGDAADVNSTTGKLKSKDITLGALPISTATQTALGTKANSSCFADSAAFNACFALDWPTGFDLDGDFTVTGAWDFTGATVTGLNGASYTAGTDISISGGAISLSWDKDYADLINTPTTTPLTVSMVTGLFTGTEDCLGANGETVACGSGTSGYTNLTEFVDQTAWRLFYSDGSGDVKELALGSSGQVLKSNGASAAPSFQADNTASGAGYVSTPPTYSDETCTAGQYASSVSPLRLYSCLGNKWVYIDSTGLVNWNNLTPITRTLTVTSPSHGTITCSDSDLSASINCGTGGSTCSATAADGASITGITATADSGYELSAWTGDLSGTTNPTTLTMSANRSIGATFTAPPSGPTPTFYFSADSATSGQSPTIGSGSVSIDSGTVTTTGVAGNALTCSSAWGGSLYFPASGNLSTTIGTIGFYSYSASYSYGTYLSNGSDGTPAFILENQGGGLLWRYMSGAQNITIPTSQFAFVELSWDYANARQAYRINGGSWTEVTGLTGSAPAIDNVRFGAHDGNSTTITVDQIMVIGEYQADLYSIRNNTSF